MFKVQEQQKRHKVIATTKKGRHQLIENHEKVTPGGGPGGSWEGSWDDFGSKGRPETKMNRKRTWRPPPRDSVGQQILNFSRFCGSFSCCFFECRFGRSPGPILSGFEVFKEIFEHVFMIF